MDKSAFSVTVQPNAKGILSAKSDLLPPPADQHRNRMLSGQLDCHPDAIAAFVWKPSYLYHCL